jgi:hypothetical protein
MTESSFLKAAKSIGFRTPLFDDTTFVGRKREVKKLLASIEGSQVTPMWIWGSRRIGKTSLSYRIPKGNNIHPIRLSCDQQKWQGLDSLCEFVAQAASSQLGIELQGSGKSLLRDLASRSKKNKVIVLILDEVDEIAINLEQEEQAFLRSTLQSNRFFGIVFVSRIRPSELLQDYSDESSRLLGVCEMIRVPMLSRGEVMALGIVAATLCGEQFPNSLFSWIYDRVAGLPVCVQALLREVLILAEELGHLPADSELEAEGERFFETVESDLQGLWKDLSLDIRGELLSSGSSLAGARRRELLALNLIEDDQPIRPIWLVELGMDSGLITQTTSCSGFIDLAGKLSDSLRICNEIALRMGHHNIFQTTQEAFRIFQLARPIKDERDLNERTNILYKLCVESTNSDKLPEGDKCLIPEKFRPVYKKSQGFKTIVAWRNFHFHDASHDLDASEKSKRYAQIGAICCRFLGDGHYIPKDDSDYTKVYRGILSEIVDSVDRLRAALQQDAGGNRDIL